MRGIRFTADITDDAPATSTSFTNLEHSDSEAVARRHAAADHGCAVGAHDDAVIWPAGRGEIERPGAHVCLQLRRSAKVRETERFRIDCAAPNENGQAPPGPAVSFGYGVHISHPPPPNLPSPLISPLQHY